jgi:hypothetical protein
MSLYAEIIAWSRTRPAWQQDVLRSLFADPNPGTSAIERWTRMCMDEARGNPCGAVPMPEDWAPAGESGVDPVVLLGVQNPRSVNAIVDGQKLVFHPEGVTVVFGENGAGKSGYTRILKRMCHARGRAESVLPNVFADSEGTPQAEVAYRVGQADPTALAWSDANSAPSPLVRVTVFDTLAAAALLEDDNEIVWVPGGLDLFPRLASVVQNVKDALGRLEATHERSVPLPKVAAGTTAAKFVAALSADTTEAQIDLLALADRERAELAEVVDALGAQDPLDAARRLELQAKRIDALISRLSDIDRVIGAEALGALRTALNDATSARAAEGALVNAALDDARVAGVGNDAWLALWRAAEAFAATSPGAAGTVPTEAGQHCLLCQQQLDAGSAARLATFHRFVHSEVAKKRAGAESELKRLLDAVHALVLPDPAHDTALPEIGTQSKSAGEALDQHLSACRAVLLALAAVTPAAVALPLMEPPKSVGALALDVLSAQLRTQATGLRLAAKPDERRTLIVRRGELEGRQVLHSERDAIRSEIARRGVLRDVEAAKRIASTRGITEAGNDLARRFVSEKMAAAFQEQARRLKVRTSIAYAPTNPRRGRSFQRLRINTPAWAQDVPHVSVLSEGERRALAIAAFLAELETRDDRSCVIFDDPVSSLDHERRAEVARRIVQEGAKRQVVVFTHDLVFMKFLEDIAKSEQHVPIQLVEIRRTNKGVGVTTGEPPWIAMKVKGQIAQLNNIVGQLRAAAKSNPAVVPEWTAHAYGRLRQCAERALEERLLGGCVERFSRGVHPTALWKVRRLTDDDVRAYLELYDKATTCSQTHDPSAEESPPLPNVDDFAADVKRLDALLKEIEKRG